MLLQSNPIAIPYTPPEGDDRATQWWAVVASHIEDGMLVLYPFYVELPEMRQHWSINYKIDSAVRPHCPRGSRLFEFWRVNAPAIDAQPILSKVAA